MPVALALHLPFLEQRRGDPDDEHRRDREAHGVQPVREVRPGDGDEDAAEHGAGHDRQLVGGAQQRVRARQQLLGDQVREACVGSRTGEAGGDSRDQSEDDDLPRADREGEQDEHGAAREVGADQNPLAGEPVDERAEQEADRDPGQEVGDQQRADPDGRAGSVLDVDHERDHGDPGAES